MSLKVTEIIQLTTMCLLQTLVKIEKLEKWVLY